MQILDKEYLAIRLIRLKRFESWTGVGKGFFFILPKGGNGQCVSGSSTQDFRAGDALVMNSTSGGKIVAMTEQAVFWSFSVCFEHLFPLFGVGEIGLLQDTMESLKAPKLFPASDPLAQECHRLVESAPAQGSIDHRSLAIRIVGVVLTAEFKTTRNRRVGFVRADDHMMQVFEELTPAELLTLSVGDMAQKFSCSRRHLNRLFHQHFGCSVAALRMELRLLKALSLLRDPDLKIIDLAEQCGFNHLGLFNACFKKRFGATPGQWRKGAVNGASAEERSESGLIVERPSCPMHADGLCPWSATNGNLVALKAIVAKKDPVSRGPANLKLREVIIRNISEVSTRMAHKSGSGPKARNYA